jgi:hypothetical protein
MPVAMLVLGAIVARIVLRMRRVSASRLAAVVAAGGLTFCAALGYAADFIASV